MTRSSPFGKESRVRILRQHFNQASPLTVETAWKFVYEELLWTDGSTGLAHLYESDKAQPGRPWYRRTEVFTDLLCDDFGNITRSELKQQIDRLFRTCLHRLLQTDKTQLQEDDLGETLVGLQSSLWEAPELLPHTGDIKKALRSAPSYEPDMDLVTEFCAILRKRIDLPHDRIESFAHELVTRARYYFTVERKRQNVLGEGFEDLLQLLIINVGRVPDEYVKLRTRANKLPGFQNAHTTRERNEAPDIAIVMNNQTELLASVKWSLRHDRQKQLSDELDCYVDLLSQHDFPRYVLITNEYDPGRLVNTDGLNRRGQKIDCIYHINLDLLLNVLHDHERTKDLAPLVASGRLRSLSDLLIDLAGDYASSG